MTLPIERKSHFWKCNKCGLVFEVLCLINGKASRAMYWTNEEYVPHCPKCCSRQTRLGLVEHNQYNEEVVL